MSSSASTAPSEPATGSAPEARLPWLAFVAALLAVAVAHGSALGGELVWDDHYLLEDAQVRTLGAPWTYLARGFWDAAGEGRVYFRPLTTYSFALDHALHGANVAGYHLTNLGLHLANTALVVWLLVQRRVPLAGASLLALVWAVMPRTVESVAWLSGRTDVLATTFVLAALAATEPLRGTWRVPLIAAPLLFLGLLSKEVAVAGVAALVAREAWASGSLRRAAPGLVTAAAACLPWLTLRLAALRGEASPAAVPWETRMLRMLESLGAHVWATADAYRPCAQLGSVEHRTWPWVVLGALALAALGVALVRFWRRLTPPDVEAIALAAAALALVSHLLPLPLYVVAADRFLYLPWVGLLLWSGPRLAGGVRFGVPLGLAAALVGGVITHWHAPRWTDELALWTHTARCAHPKNPYPWLGIAKAHERAGDYGQALRLTERALVVAGTSTELRAGDRLAPGLLQLAGARGLAGEHRAELELYGALAQAFPDLPRVRMGYALALLHQGELRLSRAELEYVAERFAHDDRPRTLLVQWPELEAAARTLRLRATPAEHATALTRLGRRDDAERLWASVLIAPGASPAELAAATRFLVLFGHLDRLAAFTASARARGSLTDELAAAADARLALQPRLAVARRVLEE